MEQWDNELEELFGEYKRFSPDPDASANFMPGLWKKIESRQSTVFRIRRLTHLFVAAAAICVVFALFLGFPTPDAYGTNGTYVDVLADIHPAENLTPLGIRTDNE